MDAYCCCTVTNMVNLPKKTSQKHTPKHHLVNLISHIFLTKLSSEQEKS